MEKQLVIDIIRNVIKKEDNNIVIPVEKEAEILDIFKSQNLTAYLYLATKDEKYLKYYLVSTRINLEMNNNIKKVIDAFNTAGIDHIIMKGYDTQNLYYDKALRMMGDVDIYADPSKEKEEAEILESLGYKKGKRNASHLEFSKGNQEIEIHYNLFCYNKKIDNFFSNPFLESYKINDNSYKMNKEYYLAYLLAHYSKHFIHGGSGLRSLIDIYLLLEEEKYDIDYMRDYLEKIELNKFFDVVLDTINYIFNTNYSTVFKGNVNELIEYCLNSGVHGFKKGNNSLNNEYNASKKRKLGFIFSKIFLKKEQIRTMYDNKQPLFFLYLRRILKLLFKRKEKCNQILFSKNKGFYSFSNIGL